ncbi:hypothetical protein CEUSTIGMA_g6865.t1 [Chlamydomonas eustigma]|uniref:Chlorophyll a-b binding protein, chloroplastic n=1 Tax=Chlamydomonas eustigma TaxID=1157962 RepID=A0A250X8M4_9CHLO|nr:hypothetical protein CEUSTIGMA_g6865.t1 [Chlamydomonas eustigma]|eukprot:GAX79424.1 hypothetical protein CEUSTIGMA_g6865.t1 [Chlamydomonas eustigma]
MQALSFRSSRVATRATKSTKKSGTERQGGAGYRKYSGDALWLPNTTRPEWLDGTLPGDRGFDPLGLARPGTFVQIGVDGQDQNLAKNEKGGVEAIFQTNEEIVPDNGLSPYSEVFGLLRFRECEVIHGRWAMLAALGCVVAELSTGVSWVDAGKVELDGASYAGLSLPWTMTQLIWIEVISVGFVEFQRNSVIEPEARVYPGGPFDPLGLASGDETKAFNLKTAELKHGRLAMVACLGFAIQAFVTGEGVVGSLIKFVDSL